MLWLLAFSAAAMWVCAVYWRITGWTSRPALLASFVFLVATFVFLVKIPTLPNIPTWALVAFLIGNFIVSGAIVWVERRRRRREPA